MKHRKIIYFSFLVLLLIMICSQDLYAHSDDMKGVPIKDEQAGHVPLLKDLYALDFPITAKNDQARKYFNQGLVLTYGFDHIDAEKSFLEAARHDPECAMCYWGAALVLGPNINAPMEDSAVPRAYTLARTSVELSDRVTDKEKMLIHALAKRYAPEPVKDRSELDRAFADAMKQVEQKYPDDPDIGVLYAEALMDLHPWDYWTLDGTAQPWTTEIRSKLESILSAYPRHPEGHHLYIHLMENSPYPEKTVPSADIITGLVPASGHLVHMASHAYFASGFYHDCSITNEKAIEVDRLLTSSFTSQGLYHQFYVPHVRQFLWACYAMEGNSGKAMSTARELAGNAGESITGETIPGTVQHFMTIQYYSLVRFGKWEEILAEPGPDEKLRYPVGVWHYMRGMAFARKGLFEETDEELKMLQNIASEPVLKTVTIWDLNNTADLLAIAVNVLAGELASERKQFDKALDHLKKGVALEEKLTFDEPPPWYYPVRQSLGAALLKMGLAAQAEKIYRDDLRKNPENGWSLFGLASSLRAQGKDILAADTEQRFKRAWARADINLTSSRF